MNVVVVSSRFPEIILEIGMRNVRRRYLKSTDRPIYFSECSLKLSVCGVTAYAYLAGT
jgi:hypothetical protein